VAIGERALPAGFSGLLPWGLIDNRPFLRALHGLALCRWRLRDFDAARAICESLLWLNPDDNQGVRDIIDVIARRLDWLPTAGAETPLTMPGEANVHAGDGERAGRRSALAPREAGARPRRRGS